MAAAVLVACCAGSAFSEQFPMRHVRLVVPFPPGSATDQVARVIATRLNRDLGQPFVVENKAGGLASIGTAEVARAAPDGYTLVFGTNTTHAANVALFKKLAYDPVKDFAPIIRTTTVPMVLVARFDAPARSLSEFIKFARSKELAGGFYSASSQVAVAKLKRVGQFTALDVPYKGSPATVSDLMGGHIDYSIVDFTVALPLIHAGKLRGLAVTTLERSSIVPSLPPIATEFPGFEVTIWHGLAAPAHTPRDVVTRLYQATLKVLSAPETKDQLTKLDMTVDPLAPEPFVQFIKQEITKWSKEIQEAGIEPQ